MRLLKIGRDASCNIVLHSEKVSSLHAELTLLNSGDITIEDKGSRNGTFIMNQRIKPNTPVNVRRGDAIRFADVELQWSQVPMPEDNSAYRAIYGIGSHFNNDFQISGATVSRYHATVKQGRDGKFYIFDHSKNGTTVDGVKISPNSPYRIKKKSSVVCGGVPVDLSRLDWPGDMWKYIAGIAASLVLIAGIGFGLHQWKPWEKERELTPTEIYNRYNHSIVMLKSIYHYKVSIGDLDIESLNEELSSWGVSIPQRFLPLGKTLFPIPDGIGDKDLIELVDKANDDKGLASATGFFISNDGKLLTNLHVVKPWLENEGKDLKMLQNEMSRKFATIVESLKGVVLPISLSAYVSQVKVEGVLDYIALVPQGEIFDKDNIKKCKVLSAGEDIREDVALIQMISGSTPANCKYVNVTDSLDVSETKLIVGEKVTTFGFPHGHSLQENSETLKAFFSEGMISRQPTEFSYMLNITSAQGASGSPIFNNKGMLIGILNKGVPGENFIGAVKSKYIKQLLESPYKK